jgi:hypothetical protein
MNNNIFLNKALKYGAIIGLIMSISFIYENYVMWYSNVPIVNACILYFVEWLIVVCIYVWLIYRFTKSYSRNFTPEMGFSFSQGLAFSLALTMLASIIVGVTATIFQSIMGYDDFVQGYIGRIDELVQLIKENSATDVEMPADFEEMRDGVRAMEQPSMLSNIYATMSNYVFMGFIICSIVSLIVRRRAVYINNSQNEK